MDGWIQESDEEITDDVPVDILTDCHNPKLANIGQWRGKRKNMHANVVSGESLESRNSSPTKLKNRGK